MRIARFASSVFPGFGPLPGMAAAHDRSRAALSKPSTAPLASGSR